MEALKAEVSFASKRNIRLPSSSSTLVLERALGDFLVSGLKASSTILRYLSDWKLNRIIAFLFTFGFPQYIPFGARINVILGRAKMPTYIEPKFRRFPALRRASGNTLLCQSASQTVMKIVSACLVGINCRYDGKSELRNELIEVFRRGELLPLCPEQLGGLPTPRAPSKIVDGDGYDVLDAKTRVVNQRGEDVTEIFIRGAMEVLKIAKILNVKEAILESKSPSCGCGRIYKETSAELVKGDGILTALLKRNGIEVSPK